MRNPEMDNNLQIYTNSAETVTIFGINPKSTNIRVLQELVRTWVNTTDKEILVSIETKGADGLLPSGVNPDNMVYPHDFSVIRGLPEDRKERAISLIVQTLQNADWVIVAKLDLKPPQTQP